MFKKPIIVLFGPTASGKSSLATSIAKQIDAVIINCDSKQLYKEIPIITAQPTIAEKKNIRHELYGVVSAKQNVSVASWLDMVKPVIEDVWEQGKVPLLVGGTGMYIKSLTKGIVQIPDIPDEIRNDVRGAIREKGSPWVHSQLDEVMKARLKPNDSHRVARAYEVLLHTSKSLSYWQQQEHKKLFEQANFINFFLSPDREVVYSNCNSRFDAMIKNGVMAEVEDLRKMDLSSDLPSMKAHGVPELISYLNNDISLEDAVEGAKRNTRHYIKRQFTWFRGQMNDVCELRGDNPKQQILDYISSLG